ncbi:hypothetical protein [Ectobacillus panaciterrae]|uniref:hypothetical protein n=1 Tax=Ectobacillus panaciterrae TaxID=363872 RepID=UPI0003FB189A|nr:hypothetical protein [Ectobacillus panaciterrae]
MKKMNAIVSVCVLLCLAACTNDTKSSAGKPQTSAEQTQAQNKKVRTEQDVMEAVFNQLSQENKERIVGTWKDATVSKTVLKESMIGSNADKSYVGKEVYLVNFTTNEKQKPNNIVVFADTRTFQLVGYGLVD